MLMRVPISAELVVRMLTTGYTIQATTRVTSGLPEGAKLIGVSWHNGANQLVLGFEAPGEVSDLIVDDLTITVSVEREMNDLAHALALECTQEYVATASLIEQREDGNWHRLNAGTIESLAKDLRYLELRGKLTYHPEDHTLVRFIDDEEVPPCPT